MRSRTLAVAAAAVVGTVALVAVGWYRHAGTAEDGPLKGGGSYGFTCISNLTPKEPRTVGYEVIANTGGESITIDALVLEDLRGLDVVGEKLVPTTKGNAIGAGYWPPRPSDLLEGVQWDRAVAIAGAVLPPNSTLSPPMGAYAIVVGLQLSGAADGTLTQFALKYHTPNGRRYILKTHGGARLVHASNCDSPRR